MTREETIKWLESLKAEIGKSEHRALWHYAEAIDMAIEALKNTEYVINLQKTYQQFVEIWEESREVVRCKDCKHKYVEIADISGEGITQYYVCDFMDAQFDDEGYCHHGERSEE